MPRKRSYSRQTTEAVALLGGLIKVARKKRGWSEAELAERAGMTRTTLRKIEQGDPTCSLGLAFEAAVLTGVPLFGSDETPLTVHLERTRELLSLLPASSRTGKRKIDDDF